MGCSRLGYAPIWCDYFVTPVVSKGRVVDEDEGEVCLGLAAFAYATHSIQGIHLVSVEQMNGLMI